LTVRTTSRPGWALGIAARWSDEGFEKLAGQTKLAPFRTETADEIKTRAEKETRRRGPRDKGDLHYAKLAKAYEESTATSQTLQALADERGTNLHTLRSQLQEARRRLLLAPRQALPGRPEGWATDRAKLLTEEGDPGASLADEEPF
jgi:hypothetical protein